MNNRFGKNAIGGAERFVQRQRLEIEKRNESVLVLASEPFHGWVSFRIHEHVEEPGVYRWTPFNVCSIEHLHRCPWVVRLFWHSIDLANLHALYLLQRFVRQQSIDRLITHNLTGCGWLVRFGLTNTVEWIHVLHDIQLLHPSGLLWWGQERSWWYTGSFARAYRWITRHLISPSAVIAPSRWILDEHKRWGFFDRSASTLLPQRPTAGVTTRRRYSVGLVTRLLFVGQIEHHKGIAFAIEALQEYPRSWSLIIIGDGSLRNSLQHRFANDNRIQWLGWQPHESLSGIFDSVDVLLVPSLCYENAPTVIFEARERGLPVLASAIGGIPEMLGENDGSFRPNDPNHFRQAFEYMILRYRS